MGFRQADGSAPRESSRDYIVEVARGGTLRVMDRPWMGGEQPAIMGEKAGQVVMGQAMSSH